MQRLSPFLAAAALLVLPVGISAQQGAVPYITARVFQLPSETGAITCGFVRGRVLAGRITRNRSFLAFSTRSALAARQARTRQGVAREHALRTARSYRALAKELNPLCAAASSVVQPGAADGSLDLSPSGAFPSVAPQTTVTPQATSTPRVGGNAPAGGGIPRGAATAVPSPRQGPSPQPTVIGTPSGVATATAVPTGTPSTEAPTPTATATATPTPLLGINPNYAPLLTPAPFTILPAEGDQGVVKSSPTATP